MQQEARGRSECGAGLEERKRIKDEWCETNSIFSNVPYERMKRTVGNTEIIFVRVGVKRDSGYSPGCYFIKTEEMPESFIKSVGLVENLIFKKFSPRMLCIHCI